ncbi:pseudouridine-5'-phosphatase [Rhipicephalus sanguineus]|uniref:pseudouridine-5'-phosphatase n=1 Tax=Rhipicephalus sanguineus TaxID=34632 RepID=UPI0020C545FB|nr:pseudouridine-5'-phosphatase [Rhipicephalus sanguineus]
MAELNGLFVNVLFNADTENLYTRAAETVASLYGKKFTWELKKRVMGTPEADAARTTIDSLGLPLTPDDYMAALDRIFEETFPKAQLMPGAERLVRHLHAHGIPIAIATSSKPSSFVLKMTRHHELLALFHHVVCSGGDPEVKRGKPHPDIFLVAASKFDEMPPPEKVLVFEDSVMGVTAALAAGMQVVMVPDPRIDEEKRRRATTSLTSLLEFKPELFGLPPFDIPAQDHNNTK